MHAVFDWTQYSCVQSALLPQACAACSKPSPLPAQAFARSASVGCVHTPSRQPTTALRGPKPGSCQGFQADAPRHNRAWFSVQVQHPGLRDSFAADAATVEALVKIFTWLFPGFEYSWLVDEVKHGLPKVAS